MQKKMPLRQDFTQNDFDHRRMWKCAPGVWLNFKVWNTHTLWTQSHGVFSAWCSSKFSASHYVDSNENERFRFIGISFLPNGVDCIRRCFRLLHCSVMTEDCPAQPERHLDCHLDYHCKILPERSLVQRYRWFLWSHNLKSKFENQKISKLATLIILSQKAWHTQPWWQRAFLIVWLHNLHYPVDNISTESAGVLVL